MTHDPTWSNTRATAVIRVVSRLERRGVYPAVPRGALQVDVTPRSGQARRPYRAEQRVLSREAVIKILRDTHQANREMIDL
jgi:hypothetical protein